MGLIFDDCDELLIATSSVGILVRRKTCFMDAVDLLLLNTSDSMKFKLTMTDGAPDYKPVT
jgi:hypothetical protein